jgi:hypothetical protein
MASGPTRHSKDQGPSNTCELLASALSGGGWVSIASRVLLARQRAGHRIPTCSCNASREHPRRPELQDDKPRQASVKDFRHCAQITCRHPVDSDDVRTKRCATNPNDSVAIDVHRKVTGMSAAACRIAKSPLCSIRRSRSLQQRWSSVFRRTLPLAAQLSELPYAPPMPLLTLNDVQLVITSVNHAELSRIADSQRHAPFAH